MITLQTPVEKLTRVGKTTASRLNRLAINTARDLLFHFPHRYEDWSLNSSIADIKPYQDISISGEVASIRNFRTSRRRMNITEAIVKDDTGSVKVIWFNQPFLTKSLPAGTRVTLSGKPEVKGREIIFKSPKYEIASEEKGGTYTGRILPVYPSAMNLTQKQLLFLINHVLNLASDLKDPLPEEIKKKEKLISLPAAITHMHSPESMKEVEQAKRRLAFDEVFYLQLQAMTLRQLNEKFDAEKLEFFEDDVRKFVESLPFNLTSDQKKAAYKIFLDLAKNQPMNRLLQGDVGSGKTLVAALAMFNTALNGRQSALMVPTEVLASQHFKNLAELLADYDFPVVLFTRTQQKIAVQGHTQSISKKKIVKSIAGGEAALSVGTHALIQSDVTFRNLALAVVDEQHRFGVEQRKKIRGHSGDKKTMPHLLSMTATPIPRTLSLVFYGDLSISSIREMPKNRLPIKSKVVSERNRLKAYEFVKKEIKKGSQVYVVCPLIEESDKLGVTSVAEESARLQTVFEGCKIASLHGKLSGAQKEEIMKKYKQGEIDILVATTVIEVGVDVANATIMIIEGAERFGLSQLHQIRGRVGRGDKQSYCFLMPTDDEYAGRLNRFVECKDGFEVSELDLKMRGAGEIFGKRQSGLLEFRFADLADTNFIEKVSDCAKKFMLENSLDEYPALKDHIESLNRGLHLE